jgi:hypothetical protein
VWYKLDDLLKANALETKTANGLQAIEWWAQQERDLLQEYCECDVRALAGLVCLPVIQLPKLHITAPNYIFGVTSALAARRASERLRLLATSSPAVAAPSKTLKSDDSTAT